MANVLAEYLGGDNPPAGLAATVGYSTLYLGAAAFVVVAVIADGQRDFEATRPRSEEGSATSVLPVLAVLLSVAVIIGEHVSERSAGEWAAIAFTLLGAVLVAGREIGTRYLVYRQYRQRALREAEERLTALVRHSSDVIAIVGPKSRLTYVSPAAGARARLEPAALLPRPATELLGAANAGRMVTQLDALATRTPRYRRGRLRDRPAVRAATHRQPGRQRSARERRDRRARAHDPRRDGAAPRRERWRCWTARRANDRCCRATCTRASRRI